MGGRERSFRRVDVNFVKWYIRMTALIEPYVIEWSLGPLHTRAKSRDHEIVRAQKKVFKGRPNTPPTSCSVKSYVTGSSTKCYFNEFLFMRVLTPGTIK
jgi:hypothetical protein